MWVSVDSICLAVVKIIVSNLKHTLSCNGSSWDQVWHGFRPFSVCGSVQTGTSFPHTPPLSFLPPRFHAFHPLYFLDRLTSPFFIFFLLFALLSLFLYKSFFYLCLLYHRLLYIIGQYPYSYCYLLQFTRKSLLFAMYSG